MEQRDRISSRIITTKTASSFEPSGMWAISLMLPNSISTSRLVNIVPFAQQTFDRFRLFGTPGLCHSVYFNNGSKVNNVFQTASNVNFCRLFSPSAAENRLNRALTQTSINFPNALGRGSLFSHTKPSGAGRVCKFRGLMLYFSSLSLSFWVYGTKPSLEATSLETVFQRRKQDKRKT